jgi:hypothetical protein
MYLIMKYFYMIPNIAFKGTIWQLSMQFLKLNIHELSK